MDDADIQSGFAHKLVALNEQQRLAFEEMKVAVLCLISQRDALIAEVMHLREKLGLRAYDA